MQAVNRASLIAAQGLEGNANQGGKRQVTLIESEIWSWLMDEMGANLPAVTRRANLMLTGISLNESKGKILQIGSCQIRIMGETKPCKRMEQALTGLRNIMGRIGGAALMDRYYMEERFQKAILYHGYK